jgi:hypothetical protein
MAEMAKVGLCVEPHEKVGLFTQASAQGFHESR